MLDLSFTTLNIFSITPMMIIIIGAIAIIILDLLLNKAYKGMYVALSAVFVALSLSSILYINSYTSGFLGFIDIDGFAILSQIIILVCSLAFLFLALSKESYREFEYAEFYALFLLMIAGYQFMVSSNHLILIFLGLEASSLALYTLIALNKGSKAMEAAIKYFTLGALGSGFFAFGIVFIYASVGSLDIIDLANILKNPSIVESSKHFLLLGFVFLMGGIGFKLSFFPFHTWVPDIYEGSSAPLAFYMSIATKIAGFVVAIRVFGAFMDIDAVRVILFITIMLTTTIPNIIALLQKDVQRMLAYSSISQAGFALACIYSNTADSMVALFLYWILFLFSNLGAFGLLWLTHNKHYKWDSSFSSPYTKFSGLVKNAPLLAIGFGICMLSLGGIPPFGLFWGKLFVISELIHSNNNLLALILLINSAIAIYYYIKLIIYMFLKEPLNVPKSLYVENATYPIITLILIALLACSFVIFFIGILFTYIEKYILMF